MNKYQQFLDFFDELVEHQERPFPEGVQEVYDMLKSESLVQAEKPILTDSGMQILEYLQGNGTKNLKAKDIADGMGVSSRKISGAIRKLVTDGFVNKFGQNPVIYSLTDKGKEFNIIDYKEKMKNLDNVK